MTLREAFAAYPLPSAAVLIILIAAAFFYARRPKKEKPRAIEEIIKPEPVQQKIIKPKQTESEIDIFGADDKTAALIIAITAEHSGIPPDKMKLTSIKRISGDALNIEPGGKYPFKVEGEPL